MTDIIHSISPTSAPSPSRATQHDAPLGQSEVNGKSSVVTNLNPAASYLSEHGMDFASASVRGESEMHFKMRFATSAEESVSAKGRHSQQTGEFDIELDFRFRSTRREHGKSVTVTTEGKLQMSGSIESRPVHVPQAPKENLVSMLRRVIEDLGRLASSKGGAAVDRILTEQRLDSLARSEAAGTKQKLSSIVEIMIMIAKLKQVLRDDQQSAKLAPERGNSGEALASAASSQLTHFRLEIRDTVVSAADLQMRGKTESASRGSDIDALTANTGAAAESVNGNQ